MIGKHIAAYSSLLSSAPAKASAASPHRIRRQRGYYFAAVLLLVLSVGAVGWTIWQLRADAVRAAVTDSENIASVLSGQLARLLDSIDNVLLDIKKSIKDPNPESPQDLHAAFDTQEFHDSMTQQPR